LSSRSYPPKPAWYAKVIKNHWFGEKTCQPVTKKQGKEIGVQALHYSLFALKVIVNYKNSVCNSQNRKIQFISRPPEIFGLADHFESSGMASSLMMSYETRDCF